MIGLLAWDYIIKPLIKGFKWMFKIYNDYVIQPLLKGAKWVFNKFTEGFKVLTNFFIRIFIDPLKKVFKAIAKVAAPVTKKLGPIITAISDIFGTIKNKVTSVLGSISKAVEDIFKWFENVSAFGGYDWATMKEGDKTKFLNAQAQYQNDILVQVAQGSVTRQVAEQQLGRKLNTAEEAQLKTLEKVREENKDIDLATVLAAQLSGVMNKLDNSKWSSSTSQAVGFLLNNGATYQMVKK
jgi:hypothetical protein